MIKKILAGLVVLLLIAGCGVWYYVTTHVRIVDYPVPLRIETPPAYQPKQSVVVTSVSVPIETVRAGLERDLPRTLVEIEERVEECIPRETIRIFGKNLFRTPRFGCNLVGDVRRGTISLRGSGNTITARFPISTEIEVRKIGDIIKRETVSAAAWFEMRASLDVTDTWRVRPDIRISYEWFEEPSFVFVGQRIRLTKHADPALQKALREVEKALEMQIRGLNLREQVGEAWQGGFGTVSLSRRNPPAWLRVTPKEAGTSGVNISNGMITSTVQLKAGLEVFVGDEPSKPKPTALSANSGVSRGRGFDVNVPVLADYKEVEPVILRALRKLAARGIRDEDIGELGLEIHSVKLYATTGGRIAVGIEADAEPVTSFTGRFLGRSRGMVWLTGTPVTQPNSQIVTIKDLEIFGDMDTDIGDLLIRALGSDEIKAIIRDELVEDFKRDYDKVIGKARSGIASVKLGGFQLSFDVDQIDHGQIVATGQGLFMPVTASGNVSARLRR